MTDLIEFLEARLAEDEEAARAATEGPWSVDRDGEVYQTNSLREVPCTRLDGSTYTSTDQINVTCDSEGMRASVELENATHIARHHPARVLREVAAKRAIIAEHPIRPADEPGDHDFGCERCYFNRDEGVYGSGYCRTLKALAAVWSDHKDYRKEWAA